MLKSLFVFLIIMVFSISPVYAITDTTLQYTGYATPKVLEQFNGYVINEKTAQQAIESNRQCALESLKLEMTERIDSYNTEVRRYNALKDEEASHRNIISQITYGWSGMWSNPYDFIDYGNSVIHWIEINGSELTCQHSTIQDVQVHARIYQDLMQAAFDLNNAKSKLDYLYASYDNFYKQEFNKNLSSVLAPFFEQKKSDLIKEAEKENASIEKFNCNAIVSYNDNFNPLTIFNPLAIFGIGSTGPKAVKCKTTNKCKLEVIEDDNHILQIGCACGHPLKEHKIKYKQEGNK